MSYKKWIYKYKYLLAEQDEIETKLPEYTTSFNNDWIDKRTPEVPKIKKESNVDWDIEMDEKPKKEPKKGRELYKKISKKVHPDKGGDEKDFKAISELYHEEDILGMFLKAEELGVELKENELGSVEETFEKSCSVIENKNKIKKETLAWVWATCPPEGKEALIASIQMNFKLEYRK